MRRWWWLLLFIPLLLALGFVVWASTGPEAMPEAQAALAADPLVEVEAEQWLAFRPADQEPTTGLILYPGGRIDPSAYAPLARDIAAEGHLVVVVPMPLNLAFLAPNRALEVMAEYPEISNWAVGGHSLGGAMAANFANSHPAAVQGLVLLGAYPAGSDDLSDQDLLVTSIYGTNDGLATLDEILGSEALLPPDTRWVAIEGGNHGQFGWYGSQSGDNPAAISRESQQAQVARATSELLGSLSNSQG
ncbi:MAG: alpha/beta hydrolase [Chloroflexota bacterium]